MQKNRRKFMFTYMFQHVYYPAISDHEDYHPCSTYGTPMEPIMHMHDFYEVCVIRSGNFSILSQDICCQHEGPCLVVYNKDCPHAQFDDKRTDYERFCIQFKYPVPEFLQPVYQQMCRYIMKSAIVILLPEYKADWLMQIGKYLLKLLQTENIKETEDTFLIPFQCLLKEINCILEMELNSHELCSNPYIMDIITYINKNLTNKITLNDIAANIHVGKTKLCTDFHKYVSMTVHQYIVRERLMLAKRYLDEEYSIDEIARICCFGSSSHFIHTFQKYFSISPVQYRNLQKKRKTVN